MTETTYADGLPHAKFSGMHGNHDAEVDGIASARNRLRVFGPTLVGKTGVVVALRYKEGDGWRYAQVVVDGIRYNCSGPDGVMVVGGQVIVDKVNVNDEYWQDRPYLDLWLKSQK